MVVGQDMQIIHR